MTERDEAIHIRCRSEELRLRATEPQDGARLTIELAPDPVEQTRHQRPTQPERLPFGRDRCPVCGEAATLTDWRPGLDWMTVQGCPCRGFFVWTALLDEGRLARLTPEDREILKHHLRDLRATGIEAWLTTRDRTVMGALLIRTERPDRPR